MSKKKNVNDVSFETGVMDTNLGANYKILGNCGKWIIVKINGDLAIYSYCSKCGFIHSCYKNKRNSETGEWLLSCEYDLNKEFRYCPQCGQYMSVRKSKIYGTQ